MPIKLGELKVCFQALGELWTDGIPEALGTFDLKRNSSACYFAVATRFEMQFMLSPRHLCVYCTGAPKVDRPFLDNDPVAPVGVFCTLGCRVPKAVFISCVSIHEFSLENTPGCRSVLYRWLITGFFQLWLRPSQLGIDKKPRSHEPDRLH